MNIQLWYIKVCVLCIYISGLSLKRASAVLYCTIFRRYILSRKKTSFFEKLNQTRSILLQFTQDLHLLIASHQTKSLISRFFLLMLPFLRNGSFIFILQSQPFYQEQLVPMTTISILRSSLALPFYQMRVVPMTTISIWEA